MESIYCLGVREHIPETTNGPALIGGHENQYRENENSGFYVAMFRYYLGFLTFPVWDESDSAPQCLDVC